MSRPALELTDLQRQEVETLAAVLSTEQIADYFGIGRTTFYRLMERDEEIAVRYKRGKAKAIGAIAQGLINKARSGDTTSMIFFLKTQAGWRETATVVPDTAEARDDSTSSGREKLIVVLKRYAERTNPPALMLESDDGGDRA